jgi:vesicle coat complex subunit
MVSGPVEWAGSREMPSGSTCSGVQSIWEPALPVMLSVISSVPASVRSAAVAAVFSLDRRSASGTPAASLQDTIRPSGSVT